ncbi:primosomal protein N' [Corynebacterium sp. 35RC1]|nr:primosomal protein N' [Corynebacterium sp. 35RC1]
MTNTRSIAEHLPVARVLPLLQVSHLDRTFDYLVDEASSEACNPGVRVRIRFNGRLVDAIVMERLAESDHPGTLSWIDRVISEDRVYPPVLQKLVESLKQRYAGTTADLLRAAIPPRHASVEQVDFSQPWEELGTAQEPDLSQWASYQHGTSFVDAVLAKHTARAVMQFLPGEQWAQAYAAIAAKVALGGSGVLIVVPDQRDLDLLEAALRAHVSAKQVTVLQASLGPQARYRRYLSVLRGQARIVIGTRNAAFAPVHNLGLVCMKDDGDENLVEPRAPYQHAREVLTTRSSIEGCSLVIGSYSRTAEAQLLVESGWAHDLVGSRDTVRTRQPAIHAVGETDRELERDPMARQARIPARAFAAARSALERGMPVLFQVPRKGYVPSLACGVCRAPARCRTCAGPMGLPAASEPGANTGIGGAGGETPALPTCRWCGRPDAHMRCGQCGSDKIRAVVLGGQRTAEELGRAFPQQRVIVSGGQRIVDALPKELAPGPGIVVATPGGEPKGTYGAVVLLDTWALLGRQDLRATELTLAQWAHAASMVEPGRKGGEVIVVADPGLPAVQALIRWDMVGAAQRELAQRKEVHFPPAAHMAAVDGPSAALEEFLELVDLPEHAEVLGPVDLPPGVRLPGQYNEQVAGPPMRLLIRSPLRHRNDLGSALRAASMARAMRKQDLPLRIQVDPIKVG